MRKYSLTLLSIVLIFQCAYCQIGYDQLIQGAKTQGAKYFLNNFKRYVYIECDKSRYNCDYEYSLRYEYIPYNVDQDILRMYVDVNHLGEVAYLTLNLKLSAWEREYEKIKRRSDIR